MPQKTSDVIQLRDPIVLELPDGNRVRVRVGPYGKGVAIVPLENGHTASPGPSRPGQRGRRPRPGTVALREQLERDAKAKRLKDNQHYVKWILQRDEGLSLAVARQIVYRERRRIGA